jgi:hypothetical protein
MSKLVCLMVVGIAALLSACGPMYCEDEGDMYSEATRSLSDFDKVLFEGSGNFFVSQATDAVPSVRIVGHDNIVTMMDTRVKDGLLEIRHPSHGCSIKRNTSVKVYVTMREVSSITLSGSGELLGQTPIEAEKLRVTLEGSGNLNLTVAAASLRTHLDGSGRIAYAGAATAHAVALEGSGSIRALYLLTETTEASLAGSGYMGLHAADELKVVIAGSGNVEYRGQPQVSFTGAGSGTLRRVD